MSKRGPRTHHVVPDPAGGWKVVAGGADRASGRFDLKKDAIDAGRTISQNQRTEFRIHNRNGQIGQSDSHGRDPHPPKG